MDDKDKDTTSERSAEEIAWDEEFSDTRDTNLASTLGDLLVLAVKIPVAIIQMPMTLLPEETTRHARAAARESFLAVRSLLGAIGDGIENMLAEPADRGATVSGPAGTWGTGRTAQPAFSRRSKTAGRVQKIEVSQDETEPTGLPAPSEETGEVEGRGLRADIEY